MEVRPFRGWRYSLAGGRDVSPFLSPPFDILTAEDKQQLLSACDRNAVAVDLPHVRPRETGPDELYAAAAERLEHWKRTGVIRQDDRPAIYAYEQTYEWSGRKRTRRAIICGVRVTPFGEDVIPHERIFPGPLADRLKLTVQTRTQLSPIFGFYCDSGGRVAELLSARTKEAPDVVGALRGVTERLWAITDAEAISSVAAAVREEPVFIADGHHRYTTAMKYRDLLAEAGELNNGHEGNFAMFALVARDDPGLVVLPAHRVIGSLREGFSVAELAAAAPEFSWQQHEASEAELAEGGEFAARFGPGAMAFVNGRSPTMWVAKLKDPEAMRRAAPREPDQWRALAPAILQRLIVERALKPWVQGQPRIEYTPDCRKVLEACRTGRAQLGVCLQAIPVGVVEAVARGGSAMPHKSTYFYPKLATGMVFKPVG